MTEPLTEHRLLIDLCLRHVVAFFWQGPGLLLINARGLPAILSNLAQRGVPVLGLEGFELDGDKVVPRLDLIYDADRLPGFPTPEYATATWPSNVWVDVTIGLVL